MKKPSCAKNGNGSHVKRRGERERRSRKPVLTDAELRANVSAVLATNKKKGRQPTWIHVERRGSSGD